MDTKQELKETQAKQRELVEKVNQMEQEKQQILQELLRLDGEIRLLNRMDGGETK